MKTSNLACLLGVVTAVLMVACGGGGGVPLGPFPDMTATEGDAPITLKAPDSRSPAVFAFTSSNPKVATISGNKATILLAGTTTITASQPSLGSYNPTSTSALLTVNPRVCTAPATNQGGVCVSPCIAPAINQNGVCVAPVTAGSFVTQNGHSWMPVTLSDTWGNANAFCNNTTINGMTGWRLPTQFDLTELYASGAMNGQGWTLGQTWASTGGDGAHATVNLMTGMVGAPVAPNSPLMQLLIPDGTGAYVTCVK